MTTLIKVNNINETKFKDKVSYGKNVLIGKMFQLASIVKLDITQL